MNNHVVYWWHLAKHTDPYTQGYIGVSKNIVKRSYEHMREKNTLHVHFHRAIEKYGKENMILTILHKGLERKDAYSLEHKYRPRPNIGWNMCVGGKRWSHIVFHKITLFHISNPEKEYTFDSITEACEALGLNRLTISSAIKRANNVYLRNGWHVVNENTDKNTIMTCKEFASMNRKGKKKNLKKARKDWVSVTMWNVDEPEKKYTFRSIGEAARNLNLSNSMIKHRIERNQVGPTLRSKWVVYKSQDVPSEHIKQEAQPRFTNRQLYLPIS